MLFETAAKSDRKSDILDSLVDAGSAAAHRSWLPDSQQSSLTIVARLALVNWYPLVSWNPEL